MAAALNAEFHRNRSSHACYSKWKKVERKFKETGSERTEKDHENEQDEDDEDDDKDEDEDEDEDDEDEDPGSEQETSVDLEAGTSGPDANASLKKRPPTGQTEPHIKIRIPAPVSPRLLPGFSPRHLPPSFSPASVEHVGDGGDDVDGGSLLVKKANCVHQPNDEPEIVDVDADSSPEMISEWSGQPTHS